jgi:hypothetical protein
VHDIHQLYNKSNNEYIKQIRVMLNGAPETMVENTKIEIKTKVFNRKKILF